MTDHFEIRLVAIFYADLAGYSRLMAKDEPSAHQLLVTSLDVIGAEITRYGGSIVAFAGDAVLAHFGTVTDALACAVTVQETSAGRNCGLPEDEKFQFRIGINLGDVFVEAKGARKGIYGNSTNVAQRLQTLADPGGICVSDAVRVAVGTRLPVDFEFIGEQAVKNIPEAVRAYRLRPRGDVVLPPSGQATRSSGPPRAPAFSEPQPALVSLSRLPITGRLLLGRDAELRQLDESWAAPSINIVSCVAWAGVGKSTLVKHWLQRLAQDRYGKT